MFAIQWCHRWCHIFCHEERLWALLWRYMAHSLKGTTPLIILPFLFVYSTAAMSEISDSATLPLWWKVGLCLFCWLLLDPLRSAVLHVIGLYSTSLILLQRLKTCNCVLQAAAKLRLKQSAGSNRFALNVHCNVMVDSAAGPSIAATAAQRWTYCAHSIWKRCASFCYNGQMFPLNVKQTREVDQ